MYVNFDTHKHTRAMHYVKNANNDLRILQNSHLKNKNKTLELKNDLFLTKL